jgi:hypothetical protein
MRRTVLVTGAAVALLGPAAGVASASGPSVLRWWQDRTVSAATSPAAAQAQSQAGRKLPLAAWAPVSRALGRDDPAYRAETTTGGLTAANPRQRLRAWFAGGGALIRSGSLAVGLGLRGVGFGPRLALLRPVTPVAAGNRVTFRYGRISEWFANGPLGLEQGFTLAARPPGLGGGLLTLGMRLSGDARAAVSPARGGVVFSGAGGALAYRGLVATDADGRRLPASLELRGRQLLLHVQIRGARYPLTVDPFIQQAHLTASDGAAGDSLGSSVAISASGTTIAAAAPFATVNGNQFQGAVYVFTRPATGWQDAIQTAKLTASDGAPGDILGNGGAEFQGENAVAVSAGGTAIAAGAPTLCFNCAPGAVYVFTRPAGGWHDETQAAKLTASDAGPGDQLGSAVAMDGNTVAAGAPFATINGNQLQGAVYIFTRPAGGWHDETQTAKLTASDGAQLDSLGFVVGISGNTVAAGAPGATINGNQQQGAVYIFTSPPGGWHDGTQAAKLTASDGAQNDGLGLAIGISQNVVIAGAPDAVVNGNQFAGAAYAFARPAGGWHDMTQTAKLTASDGFLLGYSVAISGRTAVAGGNGVIWVFAEPPGGWQDMTQTTELTNPDFLGLMEALSPTTLVAGVPFTTNGAVDVYADGNGSTSQPAAARVSGRVPSPLPAPCLLRLRPRTPLNAMRWRAAGIHIRCR